MFLGNRGLSTRLAHLAIGYDSENLLSIYKKFLDMKGIRVEPTFGNYRVVTLADDLIDITLQSGIFRVLELISIGIQHQIQVSNWKAGSKLFTTCLVSVTPYLFAGLIGLNAERLLITSLILSCVRQALYYLFSARYANNVRDSYLISSGRNFIWNNFLSLNTKYIAMSLCTSSIFYTGVLALGAVAPYADKLGGFYVCTKKNTEVNVLDIKRIGAMNLQMVSPIFITQFAWTIGKMAIDLILAFFHKVGIIDDLSNPMRSFMPASLIKYMGIFEPRAYIVEQLKLQQAKAVKPNPPIQKTIKSKVEEREPDISPPLSDYCANQSQSYTSRIKRPKKSHAIDQEEAVIPAIPPVQKDLQGQLNLRPVITINNGHLLVPLSGAGITNLNIWGMVDPSLRNYDSFQRTLQNGHIRMGGGISILAGGGGYEVRPSGDQRAIGALHKGEVSVARILNECVHIEATTEVLNKVRLFGAENMAIIYFNHESNHKNISRTADLIR